MCSITASIGDPARRGGPQGYESVRAVPRRPCRRASGRARHTALSVGDVPLACIRHKLLTNAYSVVEHDVTVLSHHPVTTGIRGERQCAVGEQEDGSAAAHSSGTNHLRPHRHRDDRFAGCDAFNLHPHCLACAICRPHCIRTFLSKYLGRVIHGHEPNLATPTNRDCIVSFTTSHGSTSWCAPRDRVIPPHACACIRRNSSGRSAATSFMTGSGMVVDGGLTAQ